MGSGSILHAKKIADFSLKVYTIYILIYLCTKSFCMTNHLVDILVEIIDFVTIIIIFWSFLYAAIQLLLHYSYAFFHTWLKWMKIKKIRILLGENLLLALEIFICADIILSVQDPSMEHLTQLAIIVAIRIVIAYFLQHEIKELSV